MSDQFWWLCQEKLKIATVPNCSLGNPKVIEWKTIGKAVTQTNNCGSWVSMVFSFGFNVLCACFHFPIFVTDLWNGNRVNHSHQLCSFLAIVCVCVCVLCCWANQILSNECHWQTIILAIFQLRSTEALNTISSVNITFGLLAFKFLEISFYLSLSLHLSPFLFANILHPLVIKLLPHQYHTHHKCMGLFMLLSLPKSMWRV